MSLVIIIKCFSGDSEINHQQSSRSSFVSSHVSSKSSLVGFHGSTTSSSNIEELFSLKCNVNSGGGSLASSNTTYTLSSSKTGNFGGLFDKITVA